MTTRLLTLMASAWLVGVLAGASPLEQIAPAGIQPPAPRVRAPVLPATIRGTVFGLNGRRLARANVQLIHAASGRNVGPAITTDENGRYEFASLNADSYRIRAGRAGYLVLEYGQRRAFERGTPFSVKNGEIVDKIDITLAPSGAISGRLLDEYGEPVEGAVLQLLQTRLVQGRLELVPTAGVANRTSNDLGRYRPFGILPGQYVVSATAVVSRGVAAAAVPGYAPVYAPGTPRVAEARLVSVGLSQDVADVDVSFTPVVSAHVSGYANNSTGTPVRPGSTFVLRPRYRPGSLAATPLRGDVNADGVFDISNVQPGEYVLQVSEPHTRPDTEGEFAARSLSVNGEDISGVSLRTSPGSTVSGRLTFETFPRGRAPVDISAFVTAIPVDPDRSRAEGFAQARPGKDMSFELGGLTGSRLLRLDGLSPVSWALKAVLVNGVDVTDTPLNFGAPEESLDNVEIVLTARRIEVSRQLTDARGQPASGYAVAFSTDRTRWTPWSRYVQLSRSTASGTFTIYALPPGDYYVAGVDRLVEDDGEWQDPAFLELVATGATRVTLIEGQRLSVGPRLITR